MSRNWQTSQPHGEAVQVVDGAQPHRRRNRRPRGPRPSQLTDSIATPAPHQNQRRSYPDSAGVHGQRKHPGSAGSHGQNRHLYSAGSQGQRRRPDSAGVHGQRLTRVSGLPDAGNSPAQPHVTAPRLALQLPVINTGTPIEIAPLFPAGTPTTPKVLIPSLIPKDSIKQLPPSPTLELSQITLVSDPSTLTSVLDYLQAHHILGFDTESRPTFRPGEISTGPHLLQLATADHAFLFPLPDYTRMPQELAAFLSRPDLTLVGFGLKSDRAHFHRRFGITDLNLLDLCDSFEFVEQKLTMGAVQAVAQLFGQNFPKSKNQSCSDWSRPRLTTGQILYAANDAWVAYRVWQELQSRVVTENTGISP